MKKKFISSLTALTIITGISVNALGNVAFWVEGSDSIYNFPDHVVSLTFDDGPDIHSKDLYTFLNQQKISATFFAIGKQDGRNVGVENFSSSLVALKNAKQRVANHTYSHNYDGTPGLESILDDINNLQLIIDPFINNEWYFIRAPHNNPNIETYNGMEGIMRQFKDIETNYDSSDWSYAQNNQPPKKAMDDLISLIESRNNQGGIIQMHDGNEFSPGTTYTLEAIKYLVPILKQKGFVFAGPALAFSEVNFLSSTENDFSDANGYGDDPSYYNTFRLVDMNGDNKMDVVMRNADGISISYNNSNSLGFNSKATLYNLDFTDAKGWKNSKYSSSIQYADVNNDKKIDIIGRGPNGIVVAINNGRGFNKTVNMSFLSSTGIRDFSDKDGSGKWGSDERWNGTVRVVDINRDGFADICARSSAGIWIAYGTGSSFKQKKLAFTQSYKDSTDDNLNWGTVDRATTIQYADVNGDSWPDIVGRGKSGIVVTLNKKVSGHEFDSTSSTSWLNSYQDVNNWNQPQYYKSIHFADINGDGMADVIGRGTEGLWAALSNGKRFTEARLWSSDFEDANNWDDAKYNSSLQYGDINGDGRADAVGRGDNGVWGGLAP